MTTDSFWPTSTTRQRPNIRRRDSCLCLQRILPIFFMATMTMTASFCCTTAFSSARMAARVSRSSSSSFLKRYSTTVATSSSDTTTATPSSTAATSSAQQQQHSVVLKHLDFTSNTKQQEQEAPPVLLLHGLLGSKRNFATVAHSLSLQLQRKRRITGLDLRNHGENHHDWRCDMGYHAMAHDVLSFMDAHSMHKAVLVGHSMGGKVAQAAALLQPERVDGLVVLDIAPVQYTVHEPHWKAVSDIVATLQAVQIGAHVSKQQVDAQLALSIPDAAIRSFCLTNLDMKTGEWKIHLNAIAEQLDTLAGFDIHDNNDNKNNNDIIAPQYHGDAFFIHGGQSRFVRHSYLPSISNYFPNHLLTTIKGAGHWIHAEAPDDTTALLKRFLDR